ncbi:MAG TPA: DUF554 domain-containing protein [Baekduia sp.]|uniref:DUF554 domain-containing protein n=1 Tax=Baekduia sp. TaxID=2600305 RepID=UPI002C017130|nr:DUF554 domain-containing protein [Baekduia sp.]HMJ34163.1 DUF554 domain-containing protein [Baekduia sp.]
MTGTLVNVGAILLGTLIGELVGGRLTTDLQTRVLHGLGLVVLVIGIDNALAWRDTNSLFVLGGVLLGGLAGEALHIEDRLQAVGDRAQARLQRGGGAEDSTVSEGFFTASLVFCVGALAVVGPIQEGLTGNHDTLYTKALLDGFASVALAASLGWGVALSAISVFVYQGSLTLAAGLFDTILAEGSDALLAMTSAGGVLIIGLSLKLLDIQDVKVGNFLPALLFAPAIAGIASIF